ncbi:MAG: ferritin-like domain-containing protein [Anaerolineae bacterium]
MHDEIIALLQDDMRGEHQAIIQYLAHAYAMGEQPIAFEVEAIAREEMRHLDWLADAISELGGDPTMERAPVDLSPGSPHEHLLKDVALEEGGIAQYRAHLEAIDHPSVRLVLSRILHDEIVHREEFIALAQEALEEGVTEAQAPEGAPPARLAQMLNQGVRHEYTVTLQYLYHSFKAEDKELAEEMQNIAINEMQHMGWLAEELVGLGVDPDMTHTELVLTDDPEEMLKADIAAEQEVTRTYNEQLPEIQDDGIKALVTRIRDHELFHDAQFKELLEEVEEEQEEPAQEPCAPPQETENQPPEVPSVGSLIGK